METNTSNQIIGKAGINCIFQSVTEMSMSPTTTTRCSFSPSQIADLVAADKTPDSVVAQSSQTVQAEQLDEQGNVVKTLDDAVTVNVTGTSFQALWNKIYNDRTICSMEMNNPPKASNQDQMLADIKDCKLNQTIPSDIELKITSQMTPNGKCEYTETFDLTSISKVMAEFGLKSPTNMTIKCQLSNEHLSQMATEGMSERQYKLNDGTTAKVKGLLPVSVQSDATICTTQTE